MMGNCGDNAKFVYDSVTDEFTIYGTGEAHGFLEKGEDGDVAPIMMQNQMAFTMINLHEL